MAGYPMIQELDRPVRAGGEVGKRFAQLQAEIDELESTLEGLPVSLGPVFRPDHPRPVPGDDTVQPEDTGSELANNLARYADHVRAITHKVRRYADRIDL